MTIWLLKLHRWVALIFALPLVFVIGTGLILSVEPWLVTRSVEPGALNTAQVRALLTRHDPGDQARSLSYSTYDKTLTIRGRRGDTVVDVPSGQTLAAPSTLTTLLVTSRRMHETLLYDARWLVVSSTVAMLVLIVLGVLMGLPARENTLSGWHKGIAWGLLPLVLLSPLTGFLMSLGITLANSPRPAGSGQGAPLGLAQAVDIVGARHDLSTLVSLRVRGGRLVARLVEDGEYRAYAVGPDGTTALPRNWPRLWHEGNFAGGWSSMLNLVTSLGLIGLLVSGPLMWLRRQLKRRARARMPLRPASVPSP